MFGKGVTRYMVEPTTSGWPSCPCSTPVEKVQATLRFLAFSLVISVSGLYRVPAKSRPGSVHSPGLPAPGCGKAAESALGYALATGGDAFASCGRPPEHACARAAVITTAPSAPNQRLVDTLASVHLRIGLRPPSTEGLTR